MSWLNIVDWLADGLIDWLWLLTLLFSLYGLRVWFKRQDAKARRRAQRNAERPQAKASIPAPVQAKKPQQEAPAIRAVRAILAGEEAIAQLALNLAKVSNTTPWEASQDDQQIAQIAKSLSANILNVLLFANQARVQFDSIELDTRYELERCLHPSDMFAIEPMQSAAELIDVVPEDMALDDDVFYALLRDNSLSVTRNYQTMATHRLLYILIDASTSMNQGMQSGGKRIQWAAGIALRLMMRAQAGEAEYMLRFFNGEVHKLYRVLTPEDAVKVAQKLVRLNEPKGDTNIQKALKAAVADMRATTGSVPTSDVLLISDGESKIDRKWLKATFDTDTRLHVAMIGGQSNLLKEVSASYDTYA